MLLIPWIKFSQFPLIQSKIRRWRGGMVFISMVFVYITLFVILPVIVRISFLYPEMYIRVIRRQLHFLLHLLLRFLYINHYAYKSKNGAIYITTTFLIYNRNHCVINIISVELEQAVNRFTIIDPVCEGDVIEYVGPSQINSPPCLKITQSM